MRTHTFGARSISTGAQPTEASHRVASAERGAVSGLAPATFSLRSMFAWYRARLDKRHHRAALAELTDRQLWDIGLTREARDRELRRPFWD